MNLTKECIDTLISLYSTDMKNQIIHLLGNYFKYMSYNNLNPIDYGIWLYNYETNSNSISETIQNLLDNTLKEFEQQTKILTKSLVQLFAYGIVYLFPNVEDRFKFISNRAIDSNNVIFLNIFLDEIIKSPHLHILLFEIQDDKIILSENYVDCLSMLFDSYNKSEAIEEKGKERIIESMKIRFSKFLLKLQQILLSYCNDLNDINEKEKILSNYFNIILNNLENVKIYNINNQNITNKHFYIPIVLELCDYLCSYIKSNDYKCNICSNEMIEKLMNFIIKYDNEINKVEENIVYKTYI